MLASYCCHISERKDKSRIRHVTSVRKTCIRCKISVADFLAIRCMEAQTLRDTLEVQKCFSKVAQVSSSCHYEDVHFSFFYQKKGGKRSSKRSLIVSNPIRFGRFTVCVNICTGQGLRYIWVWTAPWSTTVLTSAFKWIFNQVLWFR